jgi:hypothetical protein
MSISGQSYFPFIWSRQLRPRGMPSPPPLGSHSLHSERMLIAFNQQQLEPLPLPRVQETFSMTAIGKIYDRTRLSQG